MDRTGSFGLEVSKGFVGKVLLTLVGFMGAIIFARELGPVAYGAFHVIVALANVLDNPITGFANACKKRISEYDQDHGAILSIGLIASTGALVVIVGAVLLVGPQLEYFDIEDGPLFVALVLLGIVYFKLIQPMISGRGKFGTAVTIDLFRSVLTIPMQLALVLTGWGVAGMVYGLTVASILTVPVSLYVLGVRPTRPEWETVRSVWGYAKFSIPSNFVGTAYSRVDILLLGAILGSGASGQYKIASQLVLPGALVSMVMGSGLFAEVSSLASRGEEIAQKVTNNVVFASVFAIPLFFGALAMPESIVVTVFGGEFRAAAPLLVGLAGYKILETQSSQIGSVLEGLDRPDLKLYIMGATLTVNIVLGVVLVYEMEAIGIVIATIVAEATKLTLLTYFARRRVNYEIFPSPLRYQFFAAIVMFIVVDLLHGWFGVQSWIDLLTIVGIGVATYGLVLVAVSDIFLHTAKSIYVDAIEQYR